MNKILETIFSKPTITESIMEGDKKRYVVSGPFTMADRVNGNGRIYPKEHLNKAISSFREMVQAKRVKMSLDHADWSVGSLKDTAALLVDISDVQEDGFAYYQAQILDTTRGKDLKVILDAGAMVGVSTVAMGSFLEDQEYPGVEGKHPVMQDGMCLKKVDFVDDPSVSETEGRMQLESKTGTCYMYAKKPTTPETKPIKEKKMKTLEELKNEFPVIVEFENRLNEEKKEIETKLTDASTKLETAEKTIGEMTAKVTTMESKIQEMVETMKKVVPESFVQTVVPETDLLKQKDQEIATLKTEAASIGEKLVKSTESFTTLEKKVIEAEKAQTISKLQAEDPDYFKSKTAVKAFESCLNSEEVKKCYENNKAIMKEQAEATSKTTTEPEAPKTKTSEVPATELTAVESKDFNFVNMSRIASSLPKLSIEQYRQSKK